VARPCKLNADLAEQIAQDVAAGVPLGAAASRRGIHRGTASAWMARGRKSSGDDIFRQFYDAVKKAEAVFIGTSLESIALSGAPREVVTTRRTIKADGSVVEVTTTRIVADWTAIAWLLERRFPEAFSLASREIKALKKTCKELFDTVEQLTRRSNQ